MGKSVKSTSATRKNTGALLKAGYKSQKDAAKDLEKDYNYDKELSSMDTKVFVNKETGKPVVVHRGTTTLKDWGTDLLVGAGLSRFSGRFQRAKRLTKAVEKKYNTSTDAVGHSLGGNLAEHSGNHGETVTLNKAVGIRDMYAKRRASQTDIYTEGDIIGAPGRMTQRGAHKEIIKNTSGKGVLNAHKVDNLIFNDEQAQPIKAGGALPPHQHHQLVVHERDRRTHRPGTVNIAETIFTNELDQMAANFEDTQFDDEEEDWSGFWHAQNMNLHEAPEQGATPVSEAPLNSGRGRSNTISTVDSHPPAFVLDHNNNDDDDDALWAQMTQQRAGGKGNLLSTLRRREEGGALRAPPILKTRMTPHERTSMNANATARWLQIRARAITPRSLQAEARDGEGMLAEDRLR
jgi:hypothetical protein